MTVEQLISGTAGVKWLRYLTTGYVRRGLPEQA